MCGSVCFNIGMYVIRFKEASLLFDYRKKPNTFIFIFSKELCVISTEKPVYYAIFNTPQGGRIVKFIVISNELFEYGDTYGFALVYMIIL